MWRWKIFQLGVMMAAAAGIIASDPDHKLKGMPLGVLCVLAACFATQWLSAIIDWRTRRRLGLPKVKAERLVQGGLITDKSGRVRLRDR